MLYSVNILRKFQRRNCCKEIKENSQNIARPYREGIISVVIGFIDPPTLSGLDSSKGAGSDAIHSQMVRLITYGLAERFSNVFINSPATAVI